MRVRLGDDAAEVVAESASSHEAVAAGAADVGDRGGVGGGRGDGGRRRGLPRCGLLHARASAAREEASQGGRCGMGRTFQGRRRDQGPRRRGRQRSALPVEDLHGRRGVGGGAGATLPAAAPAPPRWGGLDGLVDGLLGAEDGARGRATADAAEVRREVRPGEGRRRRGWGRRGPGAAVCWPRGRRRGDRALDHPGRWGRGGFWRSKTISAGTSLNCPSGMRRSARGDAGDAPVDGVVAAAGVHRVDDLRAADAHAVAEDGAGARRSFTMA